MTYVHAWKNKVLHFHKKYGRVASTTKATKKRNQAFLAPFTRRRDGTSHEERTRRGGEEGGTPAPIGIESFIDTVNCEDNTNNAVSSLKVHFIHYAQY